MYMRKNYDGADGMVCVNIYTCNNHYDCHDTVYDEICMCSSPNVGNDTNNLNYTRVPIMSVAQRNLHLIDV